MQYSYELSVNAIIHRLDVDADTKKRWCSSKTLYELMNTFITEQRYASSIQFLIHALPITHALQWVIAHLKSDYNEFFESDDRLALARCEQLIEEKASFTDIKSRLKGMRLSTCMQAFNLALLCASVDKPSPIQHESYLECMSDCLFEIAELAINETLFYHNLILDGFQRLFLIALEDCPRLGMALGDEHAL